MWDVAHALYCAVVCLTKIMFCSEKQGKVFLIAVRQCNLLGHRLHNYVTVDDQQCSVNNSHMYV